MPELLATMQWMGHEGGRATWGSTLDGWVQTPANAVVFMRFTYDFSLNSALKFIFGRHLSHRILFAQALKES